MADRDEAPAPITTWDTQYVRQGEAFSFFREAICDVFIPWTAERRSDAEFHARGQAFAVENGLIATMTTSPFACSRSQADIGRSPFECIYINYVLDGELRLEQRGERHFAQTGDLIVFDGMVPLKSTTGAQPNYQLLVLEIPKDHLRSSTIGDGGLRFGSTAADEIFRPLRGNLDFLARNLTTSSRSELQALYYASVDMLAAAGRPVRRAPTLSDSGAPTLKDIARYIEGHLSDRGLSPETAARHAGVSTRYLHRLFAATGTTFGAHVLSRRLECAAADLLLDISPRPPVSLIGFRWGFAESSTFFRAFRRRFGCSPKEFRLARGAPIPAATRLSRGLSSTSGG